MSERFFKNSQIFLGINELLEDEARHIMASRIQIGNSIVLFNGDGKNYHGNLLNITKKSAIISVHKFEENASEKENQIIIASPIPKGDREHFLVEKLVEIGVSCWIPLKTDRSIIHPKEKSFPRLNKYVIEASKQCGRSKLMDIGPLTQWEDFINQFDESADRWIAHISATFDCMITDRQCSRQSQLLVGAVGPEGGFSDHEIESARGKGWKVANLGKTILRIETAAFALAIKLSC